MANYYRVFYTIHRSSDHISSVNTVEMSAKDIRDQLLDRLQSADDYLGLMDAADHVLQILPQPEQQQFYIELPMDAEKASYGRVVNRVELDEFILHLPAHLTPATIPGLSYQQW
ncbi:hypothetical protein [Thiospirillum jenense]|uniref:Uncharacterized protein n=1 Tax=Thiospirillum jenense TaxID=1653858 RepID=A0A839HI22_9GAMM|nr:hypothetical protein [Thiospirillum jenense]MBB1126409.1 hypothetical protein [Thiospirillum jenense]